jgi:hypothetical protein
LDIQIIMKNIAGAKELVQSVMEELRAARDAAPQKSPTTD